jgi:1-acyl-sn-glycerol-3-phosphate acyltransferase
VRLRLFPSPSAALAAGSILWGEHATHPHVGDPGLLERLRFDLEAGAFVEPGGRQLGGQASSPAASLARAREREREHPRGDAAAAPVAFDRDAADLRLIAVEQQPQRANRLATVGPQGDQMQGLVVAPVELLGAGHALLAAEHLLSHADGGLDVRRPRSPADLDLGGAHRPEASAGDRARRGEDGRVRWRRMEGLGPLIPDDSPRASRAWRRVRGITVVVAVLILVTLLAPLLALGAAAVDSTLWLRRRKPWMALRLLAMLWWFLFGELYGLLGLLAIWIASGGHDGAHRRDRVYRLKRRWLASHLAGIRALFGLRFEIEGLELAGPGPVLVMIRHASIIDNALPDAIVGRAHGLGFRFVIKRELQMLPTIDIGGRWVPTLFVRRASGDTAAELERMRALTIELSSHDGLLIYPEGTRWTPEKLARAQQIIATRQPEIAPLAARLRYVLPPRLGGTVELLRSAPEADVVLFGHVGLDGFEYISDIWSGGLIGTTVRLKFWRFAAAEVPSDRDELVAWLYERWQQLDDWIGEVRAGEPLAPVTVARAPA